MTLVDQRTDIIQESISSLLESSCTPEYEEFIFKIRNISSINQELILIFSFLISCSARYFFVRIFIHRNLMELI